MRIYLAVPTHNSSNTSKQIKQLRSFQRDIDIVSTMNKVKCNKDGVPYRWKRDENFTEARWEIDGYQQTAIQCYDI